MFAASGWEKGHLYGKNSFVVLETSFNVIVILPGAHHDCVQGNVHTKRKLIDRRFFVRLQPGLVSKSRPRYVSCLPTWFSLSPKQIGVEEIHRGLLS